METPIYTINLAQFLRLARLLSPVEQLSLHIGDSPNAAEGAAARQGEHEDDECRGRGQAQPDDEPYPGYYSDQLWARHPDDPLYLPLYGRSGILGSPRQR